MVKIHALKRGDDLRDVIGLSKQFFREYQGHHPTFFKVGRLTDRQISGYFTRFIGSEDHRAFVALEDGSVVGYITVMIQPQPRHWRVKRVGHISGLMVRPDRRYRGIGPKLLDRAVDFFIKKSVRYYTVLTAIGNTMGVGFYAGAGLEPLQTTYLGDVRRYRRQRR
jgi:ribosomal protein S18 acetylase RimI-like enzyme